MHRDGIASGFALAPLALALALTLRGVLAAAAETVAPATPPRLSDWLLAHPVRATDYPLGLSWQVPGEQPPQETRWRTLLEDVEDGLPEVARAARVRMLTLLRGLPPTGRVPVAMADARWLQANPERDPVLRAGQSVVMPARPRTVTVINGRGERCALPHRPGYEARAYVAACDLSSASRVDWAWIAQPDGRVQRFGIARWNRQAQDQPAPGAWIWAPARDAGWTEAFSERLAAHLATQGPAPDGAASEVAGVPWPEVPTRSRDFVPTASDWGGVGLLQTPTARMHPAGSFGLSISRTNPYQRINVIGQPFDWLEAGFRYIDIANRFDASGVAGNQSFKDKSFDFKIRVLEEGPWRPQVAVGSRDVAGTGLFSGEYVVASKRTGSFDWSLGLGWGYVGGRGNLRNPLSVFSSKFETRNNVVGQGGDFAITQYFRGPTSLFGGVQWQSPWESLVLKAELDGNNYQNEPKANNQPQASPINVGLVYRLGNWGEFALGYERGNTLMAGLSLRGQLNEVSIPKFGDPPRIPFEPARPAAKPDWAATSRDIRTQADWQVGAVQQRGRELQVTIDDADARYWGERTNRAVSVLHRDAPAEVDRFRVVQRRRGLPVSEVVVDRDTWVAERNEPLPPREKRPAMMARGAPYLPGAAGADRGQRLFESKPSRFEAGLGLTYQQILGGPDGFILFQLGLAERVKVRLGESTWLQGTGALRVLDNYDKFTYTAPSDLPRVRTFQREYATTARVTLPNLQATHVGQLSQNQFFSVYGGYLESMFAGVGAEWMYRPQGSRFALGVDVNQVRQRDFDQHFGLRDYSAFTGHATLYWETGWNQVQANLSAGQYLAKDRGFTVDVFRTFDNGTRMGAFFTMTDVSKQQFGEGSFDKGVYVTIPFDAFLARSSAGEANLTWRPLVRDGGAKLLRTVQLYDFTRTRDERALTTGPAPAPNRAVPPADRREAWTSAPREEAPFTQVVPRAKVAAWTEADGRFETGLSQALYAQGFRNIEVVLDDSRRLVVSLAHQDMRPVGRAVGRAARTALRLAPLDAREIRVVFAERNTPTVRYDFTDLKALDGYFAGKVPLWKLVPTVAVVNLDPSRLDEYPFQRFGDLDTRVTTSVFEPVVPDLRPVQRVGRDFSAAASAVGGVDWWRASAITAGLLTSSALLDKRVDRFVVDHAGGSTTRRLGNVAEALPWLGVAGAGLVALDNDPERARVAYAALEAGGTAFFAATGLKYVTGRARPEAGLGASEFSPFSGGSDYGAFPSRHTAVAWALATPFATHYEAPWLYGVAALTNLGRIGDREHWLSDTVAGSLLGYGLGRLFYESSFNAGKGRPQVRLQPNGVSVRMDFE